MSEDRCPNCRSRRPSPDEPCPVCHWVALRSTEMLFLDEETVTCPQCGLQRSVAGDSCLHCGYRDVLQPLSRHVTSFRISTLLLLNTFVAIGLVLSRLSTFLGVLAFFIGGLAALRTVVLVRERKRHRYPHSTSELIRILSSSLFGVFIGLIIFAVTTALGAMVIASFLFSFNPGAESGIVIILALLSCITAAMSTSWRRANQAWLLGGAGSALISTALTIFCEWSSDLYPLLGLALLIELTCIGLIATSFACRRGGALKAKNYFIGVSVGFGVIGTVLVVAQPWLNSECGVVNASLSLFIWPMLLTIFVLQRIWSWDEAFPTTRVHSRFGSSVQPRALLLIPDNTGIEFDLDEPCVIEGTAVKMADASSSAHLNVVASSAHETT